MRINLGLYQGDVNVIWDLAVHDFAILEYFSGCRTNFDFRRRCRPHSSRQGEHGPPDSPFLNGTIAHLNVNWLAPVKIRRTLIGGSRRMIVYDDLEPSEKIKVYDRGVELSGDTDQISTRSGCRYRIGDMWAPQLSSREALLNVIGDFAGAINERRKPISSAESGLRVVRMLEAAALSIASHGHPVEFSHLKVCIMIPLVDLAKQHRALLPELSPVVMDILQSGNFVLGEPVQVVRGGVRRILRGRAGHRSNTGTSALHLALLAAGVGPGDEVITVSMTFVATAAAILYCGAKPVFVDVDPVIVDDGPFRLGRRVDRTDQSHCSGPSAWPHGGYARDPDFARSIAHRHRGCRVRRMAPNATG